MEITRGRTETEIGLIDGSVDLKHPELVGVNIGDTSERSIGQCVRSIGIACLDGIFIVGILCGN
jgi:hypothetical protein